VYSTDFTWLKGILVSIPFSLATTISFRVLATIVPGTVVPSVRWTRARGPGTASAVSVVAAGCDPSAPVAGDSALSFFAHEESTNMATTAGTAKTRLITYPPVAIRRDAPVKENPDAISL
jgi:hypothetical protein